MLLVIGGAGYIGSHFVHSYIGKLPLLVLDDLSTGHRQSVPQEVPLIEGDFGDRQLLHDIFTSYKIDAVLHFAAKSIVTESVEEPLFYYENNVGKMLTLLQEMNNHHIQKLLFASTAAVYGQVITQKIDEQQPLQPINPYGHSKCFTEQILQDVAARSKLNCCIFRFFNAAGAHQNGLIGEAHNPETHLIPVILKSMQAQTPLTIYGSSFPTNDGTAIRDYVHVEDIAAAFYLAYEKMKEMRFKGEAFNLGSNKGSSVMEILQLCQRTTTIPAIINWEKARTGEPAYLVASTEKARRILGWQPTKSIQTIIESAWKWHQNLPFQGGNYANNLHNRESIPNFKI